MTRVLKWPVPIDGEWHEIGAGKVALVDHQDDTHVAYVWTIEDDANAELEKQLGLPRAVRMARVYGTEQEVPPFEHLGSYRDGPDAWHVFAFRARDQVAGDDGA